MGHEQMLAGPDPCNLHLMGQDIIEYKTALWDPLMLHRGIQKDFQGRVQGI